MLQQDCLMRKGDWAKKAQSPTKEQVMDEYARIGFNELMKYINDHTAYDVTNYESSTVIDIYFKKWNEEDKHTGKIVLDFPLTFRDTVTHKALDNISMFANLMWMHRGENNEK